MIIGDLNARIGHWNNAEDDSDFNDNEEVKSRNSRNNYINQFWKFLIDFCTTFQCLPLNGNTAGDPDGQYTFVSEQGNSVIDYALVSLDFMSKASLFLEIGCRSESSHMPLPLSISYNPNHCTTKCKTSTKEHRTVFRWDPDKTDLFSEAVSSNIFKENFTEAYNLLNESAESATKLFTDNLLQAADVMKRTFWFDNSKDRVTNQWFDRECKVKKRETRQALLRFKKTNDDKDKHIYVQKRSQYKSTIAEKK